MILYFSSTGNCKYAAEQIAAKTVDRAMSLSAAYQNGEFSILPEPGEALGFVLPTYFGVLPSIVVDFLQQAEIRLDSGNYVYTVDTYGFHYGNVAVELAKILRKKRAESRTRTSCCNPWTTGCRTLILPIRNMCSRPLIKRTNCWAASSRTFWKRSASGSRENGPRPYS